MKKENEIREKIREKRDLADYLRSRAMDCLNDGDCTRFQIYLDMSHKIEAQLRALEWTVNEEVSFS